MRVLLDENIDRRLKESFDNGFVVMTVTERGWSGREDGELLRLAEAEFDAGPGGGIHHRGGDLGAVGLALDMVQLGQVDQRAARRQLVDAQGSQPGGGGGGCGGETGRAGADDDDIVGGAHGGTNPGSRPDFKALSPCRHPDRSA